MLNLKPLIQLAAAHGKATAILVAVTVASAGYAGWLHEHDARVAQAAVYEQALAAASARTARTDTVRLAADTVLRHDSVRVAARLRTDTLWRTIPDTLRTAADTAHAIAALPIIRAESDSTARACRDFVTSCAAYRTAAESTMAALRAQLALTTKIRKAEQPSRWAPVWRWGERLGLACAAYSLGARRPCWR